MVPLLARMRIAVLSQSIDLYSTRRLVDAGRRAGHTLSVVDYMQCHIGVAGPAPVSFKGGTYETLDAFIPRIGASATHFGVSLVRQLERMGKLTPITSEGIVRSRDKILCLQTLEAAGIPVPATVYNRGPYVAPGDLVRAVGGPPVVIKVLEGTQGIGVVLCETQNAAESSIEAFRNLARGVLVQEFVEESAGTDLRCIVVGTRVVAAMRRQARKGEFRSNLHRGGSAEAVKLTDEEKDIALRAAAAVGLGVAGVDILQSDRGPLVVEVNSSPGLEGIERATRLDVAGSIIRYVARLKAR